MAKRTRRRSKKAPVGGKSVKFGKRMYKCRAKRVKKGFGHKGKTTRVYCRRAKKA